MSAWTDLQFRIRHDGVILSKVVGVTYERGYPNTAYTLLDAVPGGFLKLNSTRYDPDGFRESVKRLTGAGERVAGVLIRDPHNAADPHAVEVHVPMLECRVGFLPMSLARHVTFQLDQHDRAYQVNVWAVANLSDERYPGIRVCLKPVDRAG